MPELLACCAASKASLQPLPARVGAVNHPGSPLVARTPGGSLKVDDLRFAAKVAHLSHSFPDAGEEEVAAALLHADYHPNDAKQARPLGKVLAFCGLDCNCM